MVRGAQHSHAQQGLAGLLSGLLLLAVGGYAAAATPVAAIGDKFPMPAVGVVAAHQARMSQDPHWQSEARVHAPPGTPMTEELGLQWRNMPGPAWVGSVPAWVTDSAKNYHRRGLPLVDLWQSSHYMVALGLSNHGVPGVYFTQKLP